MPQMRHVENDAGRESLDIPADFIVDCSPGHLIPQKIWLRDMIRILSSRLLGLHIEQLERTLWESRYPATPMPKRFHNIVQIILSQHSSQSAVFHQKKRKPSDDLFFSPEGKGSGTWAVHQARSEAWLKRHQVFASQLQD
jgi:hypothetical protein